VCVRDTTTFIGCIRMRPNSLAKWCWHYYGLWHWLRCVKNNSLGQYVVL